jgi:aryl-alcohol dehydrogenase-like predicted oxidoreductase/enamine deaminase RidA (YjgF/YER057c/UK114 family)
MTMSSAPVSHHTIAPGLTISRVLTGLWQVADLERDGRSLDHDVAAQSMAAYADRGLTTFDMADHYGSAELIAGRFAGGRAPRADVQLLTKWVPSPGPLTRADVRASVERALDRLQRTRVDLMQFHAWNYADPAWLDALFWLDELRQEGLIAHLGLTNTDTAHLRVARASGIPIVSNQVCWSLLDRRPRSRMAAYALQQGVSLLAYGTVAGGFLSDRWLDRAEPDWGALETWSQMKYGRFVRTAGGWDGLQRVLRAARAVADRHGVSIANVACRYVLEQPAVGGIIIGARLGSSEHIDDTLRLFSFQLSEQDHAELEEAVAALAPLPGEPGDEYRVPPFLTASGDLSHHVASFPSPYPVRVDASGRRRVLSGTVWERDAGYARAMRVGDVITVSGTTATHGARVIGGDDPAAQAHAIIDKIAGALQALDARLDDVIRTRIYVRHMGDWEAVARVHGERFGHIQPANTLVQAALVGDEYLVEIEADALVSDT